MVVEDDRLGDVAAERTALAASVGKPVLTLEAPQNAPAGGAYLLVLYAGQGGPQQVDWYWQPRSSARRPAGTRLMFDRIGVPLMPDPEPLAAGERARLLGEKVAMFWVNVTLAGKAVARGHGWAAVGMLGWAATSLAEVRWLVERGTLPGYDDVKGARRGEASTNSNGGVDGALSGLRELCRGMDELAPRVAELGADAHEAAAVQTRHFLDMVENEGAKAGG